jgi:hypothetical protein
VVELSLVADYNAWNRTYQSLAVSWSSYGSDVCLLLVQDRLGLESCGPSSEVGCEMELAMVNGSEVEFEAYSSKGEGRMSWKVWNDMA